MRHILALLILVYGLVPLCLAQAPAPLISQGITTSKPGYELGEPVTFTYAVRNDNSVPVAYTFPTAKQLDLWVMLGDDEIYRLSTARPSAQAASYLSLRPGETKSFCIEWNQTDNHGKAVGPGTYTVYAQLTPTGKAPPQVSATFRIGLMSAALVPITVCQAIANAPAWIDRRVTIVGIYEDAAPSRNDSNTKAGPPVTSSDWALCDATGCMYVSGATTLDPVKDLHTHITVVGRIQRNNKGQVYLILESATTQKGSVCP